MKNKLYNILILILSIILIVVFTLGLIKSKKESTNPTDTVKDTEQTSKEESKTEENIDSKEVTSDADSSSDSNRFEGLTMINDNRGVPVLYYHSIDDSQANEVILSKENLRKQLTYIRDSGYTTLTMAELNDYIKNNKEIPEKSIVITFDDGYMDNYINAFPILKELNMKATIFVITNGIDDGYYMSKEQIKELSNYGIDIESHTKTHCHLNTLSYEEQLKELKESKNTLEEITGKEIISIAYPFGDFNENSVKAAQAAGYSLAFTTDKGYAKRDTSSLKLNRIYVSSANTFEQFKERLK